MPGAGTGVEARDSGDERPRKSHPDDRAQASGPKKPTVSFVDQ
jgi:hypothetical protein